MVHLVVMVNSDTIVDTKGRILIPKEIRDKLNLKPGVKLLIRLENDKIALLKTTTTEDFQAEVDQFGKKLKKITAEPISTEKLF